jgi:phage gpG-like protein
VRVSLRVDGAEPVARRLEEVSNLLEKPLAPLLDALAADWVTHFQSNIRDEGRGGVSWPALHPVTLKIRKHYGHTGGKLIRGGDLLHSLSILSAGPTFVEVGSRLAPARILQDGGTFDDPKTGKQRQVQAFPFVYLTEEDVDETFELITVYFLGESDA